MGDDRRTAEGTGAGAESGPPARARARARAIVLTFDNLGEASELQRGGWTPDRPGARHPSVTRALPRLLDELDVHGLRATFFVEAINCELNPDAVTEIARRGHELGSHGWSHEPWSALAAGDERRLLDRGDRAFAELGLAPRAFRPPGGEPTAQTTALLRGAGYRWWSPLGGRPVVGDGGLVRVPFQWALVDAYHLMGSFADLRRAHGDPAAPAPAPELADRLAAALSGGGGELQTLILHPFLMLDDAWFAGVRRLLALLAELARTGRARVMAGGTYAGGLSAGP